MCGIAGALDLTGTRLFSQSRLLAMLRAIAHRGPDDESFRVDKGVAMGARRLAILDPEQGRQPTTNQSNAVWCVCNGEIFDYPSIREQLLARGHLLRTKCDTELWPYLYEAYGESIFERVSGQFALALWNENRKTLLLGRDRVGICPLYYTVQDGWLLWASEVKALLASKLVPILPDPKGIDYLFNFFCASTRRTFFKDIHILPPGHYINARIGQLELKKYWDLDFPDQGEERQTDAQVLVEELGSLLQAAVNKRLYSDVPVISYTSGGLDSSIIVSLSNTNKRAPIPLFTVGMDHHAGPDERRHSEALAKVYGAPITTLAIDARQIAHALPDLIMAAEGPILDTSCAALMLLAAEVHKQGYKVALTGEGADEALAGYFWFKTQKIGNWVGPTLSGFFRKLLFNSIHKQNHPHTESVFGGTRPAQQYLYELMAMPRNVFYSEEMWESLAGYNAYKDIYIPEERMKRWDPLNQSLYLGYKIMLPGLLMISKGDRIAMRSAVETRYPFLDDSVINFCASIAPQYKLRGLTDKWLLRELAKKILPLQFAKRPKTMFRANLSRIFLGANRPAWVDQLLSHESLIRTGYFDPNAVKRERDLLVKYPRVLPRQYIFDAVFTSVITTQLWHHLFCGGGLCELPTWQAN